MAQFAAFPIDQRAHPRAGEQIRTENWCKPVPTNKFDWSAWFDNDEPDDNGNMPMGFGPTEQDAIADLLANTEE